MIAQLREPILQVKSLCKHYPVLSKGLVRRRVGTIKACDDVNFDLLPGETLGIVGESGSGKTTTARAILRATKPSSGQVLFRTAGHGVVDLATLQDRQLKPLRAQMQMIFQDPFGSLNPRMTVRDIVAEPLVIHRMARGSELDDRVVAILKRVGIRPEYRTRYPHAFSGGQRQRIGIARALIMRPRFVVADEAVSALDVSVQAQVINLLRELQQELGLTYLFIAHDLSVVRHVCDRVAVMYAGRIVELSPTAELFADPRHPYTRMLLSAIPQPDPERRMTFDTGGGEPVDLSRPPTGCAFHPRCPARFAPCDATTPALVQIGPATRAACYLHTGTRIEAAGET
jgi:oligopeptide/dipeptide ABC transporter ATP-binding protein